MLLFVPEYLTSPISFNLDNYESPEEKIPLVKKDGTGNYCISWSIYHRLLRRGPLPAIPEIG